MPNNDNRVTRFAQEWFNEEQIEEARNNSLQLERIDKNSTLADMIETVDANFREIARHGGGPAGINGLDGLNGEDGVNVEYIYALSDLMNPGEHYPTDDMGKHLLFISAENNGYAEYNGVKWYDNAQPISKEHKNEYVFSRFRRNVKTDDSEDDSTGWYYADAPVLWAHWGETGQDGDGVEYIFMVSQNELSNTELGRMFKKKADMDDYEQAIFNIDDFYPGSDWFTKNKSKAQSEFQRLGLNWTSEIDIRWSNKFGFCEYGEWTDEPTGVSPEYQYEYVSIRKSRKDENDMKIWGDYSLPALWSNYTFEGRIFIIYKNTPATEKPSVDAGTAPKKGDGWWDVANDILILNPNPNTGATPVPEGWTNNNINGEEGEITWMCSGVFDHSGKNTYWSNPSCISGKDGKNGEDGTTIEFIYALSKNPDYPRTYADKELLFNAVENDTEHNPKYSIYGRTKWFDRAQPISAQDTTEYMWARRREKETDPWEYDPEPIIWAHWGEDGTDGDGVEYIFAVTNVEDPSGLILPKIANLDADQQKIFQIDDFVPSRNWFAKSREKAVELLGESFDATRWNNYYGFDVTSGWNDDPIQVDAFVPFQWVSIRRSTADEITGDRVWEDFSDPVLWNSFGKSTRVFVIYCNMPADEEHPDREIPNKPVDGTGKWVNTESENYLDLTGIVDALTGVTPEQKAAMIGVWADNNVDVRDTISWMCSGIFTDDGENISWSEPFRITGAKGKPGEDGDNMEYVYCLSPNMPAYPIPSANMSDDEYDLICSFFYNIENAKNANLNDPSDPVNEGLDLANIHIDENGVAYYEYTGANGTTAWYDTALSIDDIPGKKTEWVWLRTKSYDDPRWSFAPTPVIWAHWGEDGTDGDGVEYIFNVDSRYPLPIDNNTYESQNPNIVFESEDSQIGKYQRIIYQIDDFYPGVDWFLENETTAREAIVAAGLTIDESTWTATWNQLKSSFNRGWSDNPIGTSKSVPFEYVSIRKQKDEVWGEFSTPTLWSKYSLSTRVFVVYCNMNNETDVPIKPQDDPVNGRYTGYWNVDKVLGEQEFSLNMDNKTKQFKSNALQNSTYPSDSPDVDNWTDHIGYWEDDNIDVSGTITWMCSGIFNENGDLQSWSEPFRITGAKGRPGADGSTIEFVYALSDTAPKYPAYTGNNYDAVCEFFDNVEADHNNGYEYNGTLWYDNPQGIANEEGKKTEWVWSRSKSANNESVNWTFAPAATIWSHWGEDGTDGDGIEYIFCTKPGEWSPNSNTWEQYTSVPNNDTARYTYGMDDFIPHATWFSSAKKLAVQNIMLGDGKTFVDSDWDDMKTQFSFSSSEINLGLWVDNPSALSGSYPYQYVSIRKTTDGIWGPFSYPVLWSKYGVSRFTSLVFAAMKPEDDLSDCVVTGGTFSNPIPDTTKRDGSVLTNVVWEDVPYPSGLKTVIWMCSALFVENSNTEPVWSSPKRMEDSNTFQVEWSAAELTPTEISKLNNSLSMANNPYNFGTILSSMTNYSSETERHNAAEIEWRNRIRTLTNDSDNYPSVTSTQGVVFGDNSQNAILMATCQEKNGVWTNWVVKNLKGEQGEKGEPGTSIDVKGKITYEINLPQNTVYNTNNANTAKENYSYDPAPRNGDIVIVYPAEVNNNGIYWGDPDQGGALYMWMYDGSSWIDYNNPSNFINQETTGSTYVSPNGHLILWDGDTWQDLGNIQGPIGKSWKIIMRYAKDNTNGTNSKVFVDVSNIEDAKYLGILLYLDGTDISAYEANPNLVSNDPDFVSGWTWMEFRGQDGYGYEYIFKASNTNQPLKIPPHDSHWEVIPDVKPWEWDDDPIEPTPTNRYVWMCWRKYNHETGRWTPFAGKAGTNDARLWQVYANSVIGVNEYFHADESISPVNINTTPVTDTSYWFSNKSDCGWGLDKKYLFNIEQILYSDNTSTTLDPHFICAWEDGIDTVEDYYIIESATNNDNDPGEVAPRMNQDGSPITESSTGHTVEGRDYWTTSPVSTKINKDWPVLWNITKKIYNGGRPEAWTLPVVIGVYGEGGNGADSIYIDLDNEMDSIQIDIDNKVLIGKMFETNVSLYSGGEKIKMKDIDISGEENINCTVKYYSGDIEITGVTPANMASKNIDGVKYIFTVNTDDILSSVSTKIVISATSLDDITRKTSYTLVGVTLPDIYRLIPSVTAIIKNNNALSVNEVSASVVKITGDTSQTYTSGTGVNGKFKLYVQKNNETKEDITSTFKKSTTGLDAGDKLTFTIEIDTDGNNSYETVIDKETIYVLLQGENGASGNSIYRRYAQYVDSWGAYKDIVSITADGSRVTFKDTSNANHYANTTTEPKGVDDDHCIEVMSEKIGENGIWSTPPIIIARQFSDDEIESKVNAALTDDNQTLVNFINEKAGEAVSSSLGGYATTDWVGQNYQTKGNYATSDSVSNLSNSVSNLSGSVSSLSGTVSNLSGTVSNLSGSITTLSGTVSNLSGTVGTLSNDLDSLENTIATLDYVNSSTFTTYKSDASKKIASSELITANSTFAKDTNGYLILTNGSSSAYKTIEEYYASLSSSVKNSFDTDSSEPGTGLEKPTVVKNLIDYMKSRFRFTYTEVASIKTEVADKMSLVQIMAAIQNPDGTNNIAAAIFAEANETGSGIILNADRINLTANHKLALNSGTFTINSENFKIDEDGKVTAKGSIIADKFMSISNVPYPYDTTNTTTDYVGALNKSTLVDSRQFNISATGSLSKRTGSGTKDIANSIYITLIDEIDNNNPDITENGTTATKLYAVPTLCMMYNGVPYILNPSNWKSLYTVAQSNMRFIPQHNILKYTINSLPTGSNSYAGNFYRGSATINNKALTYYIMRPDITTYVSSKQEDSLYRIKVLSWGSDSATEASNMYNASLKNSTSTSNQTDCAYTTYSLLNKTKNSAPGYGENGLSYTGSGSTSNITSDNCTIFNYFLPSSSFTFGISDSDYCQYKATFDPGHNEISTDYGADKLFNFAKTLLKDRSGYMKYAHLWNARSEGNQIWYNSYIDGLDNIIPFSGSDQNSLGYIEISIYPTCTIGSSGNYCTCNSNISTVLVNCHVYMERYGYQAAKLIESDREFSFNVEEFKIDMNFDLIIKFNSAITNYNPDASTTYNNVFSYVKGLLESNSFPYSTLGGGSWNDNFYYKININSFAYGSGGVFAWGSRNSNGETDIYG